MCTPTQPESGLLGMNHSFVLHSVDFFYMLKKHHPLIFTPFGAQSQLLPSILQWALILRSLWEGGGG